MHSDNTLAIHLQELEESLLQSTVRKSEFVSQLLSEEFVEFGSSGHTFTKEQSLLRYMQSHQSNALQQSSMSNC